jgi:hypothetical protein
MAEVSHKRLKRLVLAHLLAEPAGPAWRASAGCRLTQIAEADLARWQPCDGCGVTECAWEEAAAGCVSPVAAEGAEAEDCGVCGLHLPWAAFVGLRAAPGATGFGRLPEWRAWRASINLPDLDP